MILEIACFNLASAKIAQAAGADRIELCEDYAAGGVTPSHELILAARRELKIPLHVIIRPRGGNFRYSQEEILKMKEDILFCKTQGIQGVVFGTLTKETEIDAALCKELVNLSKPMAITFHRAVDECPDLPLAFAKLIESGVDRVLTSGGKGSAHEHLDVLTQLQQAFGKHVSVMPGGGIRASNILKLKETGCFEFHSAALTGSKVLTDAEEVKKLGSLLKTGV